MTPLSASEKLNILKQEVNESIEMLDERRGILHIRRHLAATPLFKGIPNFRAMRIAMLRAATNEELFTLFDTIEKCYLLPLVEETPIQPGSEGVDKEG